MRAAGKAIVLLVEEVERLHVDVWHGRALKAEAASGRESEAVEGEHQNLLGALRARLRERARSERPSP